MKKEKTIGNEEQRRAKRKEEWEEDKMSEEAEDLKIGVMKRREREGNGPEKRKWKEEEREREQRRKKLKLDPAFSIASCASLSSPSPQRSAPLSSQFTFLRTQSAAFSASWKVRAPKIIIFPLREQETCAWH